MTILTVDQYIPDEPTELLTNGDFETLGTDVATNLFGNPGFETAGAGGNDIFAIWDDQKGSGVIANETTIVHGGGHASKLTYGTGWDTSQYNAIYDAVIGETYQFTIWVKGGPYYVALSDGLGVMDFDSGTASDWTRLTETIVATHATVYCQLTISGAGSVYYDDATLVAGGDWFGTWIDLAATYIDIAADAANVHGGVYAVKVTGDGGAGSVRVRQDVTVIAEHTHRLTVWTHGDNTYSGEYSIYDTTNAAWITPQTTLGVYGSIWIEKEIEFETPAGCVAISVFLYAPTSVGSAWFDDVSLVDLDEVPDAHWVPLDDVLLNPKPQWNRGLPGADITDLVANTGILTFDREGAAYTLGLPEDAELGFHEGTKIRAMATTGEYSTTELVVNGGFEVLA